MIWHCPLILGDTPLIYEPDDVPSKFNFFFGLQQANLIDPSLKINETMEALQNRRFYFEV
jgi:hypothetical protein